MGISFFYRWLKDKNYKVVLRRGVPQYVSSLSLDANGIIHSVAQKVYAYGEYEDPRRQALIKNADPKTLEAEFHNAISVKLQEILTLVRPQEIFTLAVDGVAPQGKIAQQRQRRFRSAIESSDKAVFDSNSISPGTDFMIRLDNYLQRWIISYQSTLPPRVIYSSHMVPGEGEHKIIDLMRRGDITGDGAHVLYGMDADLIMLSLIAPLDRISLVREDIRDVIDIDSLKVALKEELKLPTCIRDFVVMIFTIGNDFLPHMPSLENLDEAIATLMNVYKNTGVSLTTTSAGNDDIDWKGMTIFLSNLAKEEPRLLKAESIRDVKHPSRMLQAAIKRTEKIEEGNAMMMGQKITFETIFDYNTFRGAWYQNELVPRGLEFNLVRLLVSGHNFGVTMDKVIDMCQQYLIGMAWVYNYYSKGTNAINTDFVYRYHHTPLLTDLVLVLSQQVNVEGYLAHPDQIILNPIHQLLSVLPLKSKNLLPREVMHLMSKDSPIADMYPETAVIERDGKNTEWQGIVLIPFVEPYRVIEAVNTTTNFTIERARIYSQADNIVLDRDPEIDQLNMEKKKFRQFLEQEKGRGRGRDRGYTDRSEGNRGRGRGDRPDGGRGYDRTRDDRPEGNRGRGRGSGDRGGRGRSGRTRDDRTERVPSQVYTQPTQTYIPTQPQVYTQQIQPVSQIPTYLPPPTYAPTLAPTLTQPVSQIPTYLPPPTYAPTLVPTAPTKLKMPTRDFVPSKPTYQTPQERIQTQTESWKKRDTIL